MLILTSVIVLMVIFAVMALLDPLMSRLGEVNECLARLENIRRVEKEMHDFAYQWWVLDLKKQRDELIKDREASQAGNVTDASKLSSQQGEPTS